MAILNQTYFTFFSHFIYLWTKFLEFLCSIDPAEFTRSPDKFRFRNNSEILAKASSMDRPFRNYIDKNATSKFNNSPHAHTNKFMTNKMPRKLIVRPICKMERGSWPSGYSAGFPSSRMSSVPATIQVCSTFQRI